MGAFWFILANYFFLWEYIYFWAFFFSFLILNWVILFYFILFSFFLSNLQFLFCFNLFIPVSVLLYIMRGSRGGRLFFSPFFWGEGDRCTNMGLVVQIFYKNGWKVIDREILWYPRLNFLTIMYVFFTINTYQLLLIYTRNKIP